LGARGVTDEEMLELSDEQFDAHWDKIMDATSTVYSLRPGHVLTQADFDAIQTHDQHYRDGEETATAAFHRGYKQGLREGGSADIEQMREKLDAQFVQHSVDKAMRRFAEKRGDKWKELCEALVGQFDHQGCTCTFPDEQCCAFSAASAAIAKTNPPASATPAPAPLTRQGDRQDARIEPGDGAGR
jgi:hypothetical protein